MSLENDIATLSEACSMAAHLVRQAKTPGEKAKAIGMKAQAEALLEFKRQEQTDAEVQAMLAAAAPRDAFGRVLPDAPNPWAPRVA
ncbi:MAG: hypothetical protein KIS61_09300 [Candidatus Eremiobacteraeota bacterium]|nr:hypothetical protein [Candidatus Eremiobacteraeota bacterium]